MHKHGKSVKALMWELGGPNGAAKEKKEVGGALEQLSEQVFDGAIDVGW